MNNHIQKKITPQGNKAEDPNNPKNSQNSQSKPEKHIITGKTLFCGKPLEEYSEPKKLKEKPKEKTTIIQPNSNVIIPITLDISKVEKLSDNSSFFDAFLKAKQQNKRILSNRELDQILVKSNGKPNKEVWEKFFKNRSVWSGTITAYETPDKPLEEFIQYKDSNTNEIWKIQVPISLQGKTNIILVLEYPNYDIKKETNSNQPNIYTIIYDESNLISHQIPGPDANYKTNPITLIPSQDKNATNPERHLYRINNGSRVGPVHRSFDADFCSYVVVYVRMSYGYGVLVATP